MPQKLNGKERGKNQMETMIKLEVDDHTLQLIITACTHQANVDPDHFHSLLYRQVASEYKQKLLNFQIDREIDLLEMYGAVNKISRHGNGDSLTL